MCPLLLPFSLILKVQCVGSGGEAAYCNQLNTRNPLCLSLPLVSFGLVKNKWFSGSDFVPDHSFFISAFIISLSTSPFYCFPFHG